MFKKINGKWYLDGYYFWTSMLIADIVLVMYNVINLDFWNFGLSGALLFIVSRFIIIDYPIKSEYYMDFMQLVLVLLMSICITVLIMIGLVIWR